MDWPTTAAGQSGVIARRQLRDAGRSDSSVDAMLRQGAVVAVHDGVYLVRGAPFTYEARLWAALLATHGVLGFATAAHLWGMADRPDDIDVIIPRNLHRARESGVRTHRIDLRTWAVTTRHEFPVTLRRETALDLIGRLPHWRYGTFADRALQEGWLSARDFEDRVKRQPGRIGNTRLRLLTQTVGDGAAAQSERALHGLLRRAGLTGWTPNLDVWCDGELVGVLDVAIPEAKVAIEVDGMAFHTSADRFQRDRTRQNALTGLGWTVLRFTWSDLIARPGYVIATIRRHLANSGYRTAAAGVR